MVILKREGPASHIARTDDASITGTRMSTWMSKNTIEKSVKWGYDYQLNFQLNYKRNFDKHAVQGALVYEKTESDGASVLGGREGFPVFLTDQFWAASSARADTWGRWRCLYQKPAVFLYIGQFNYAYANKYLVDFSVPRRRFHEFFA